MAGLNQDLPAEAGIGAEAHLDPITTVRATALDDGDTAAKLLSGLEAPDIKTSPLRKSGENGSDTDQASGDQTDPVMDDQLQVLSRIKMLQDELVKVERNARLGQTLQDVEKRWDDQFERFGGDTVRLQWSQMQQLKAQSFVKDATAFAFGREWAHESEDSFIWKMLERAERDKQLIQLRALWEAKKGIERPKDEDSPKPPTVELGLHRSFQLPAYLDPLSDEHRFSVTPEARGYDQQERIARDQIHDIVRQKHDAFTRWKTRPQIKPPKMPDVNDQDSWPRPAVRYVEWKIFRYCSPYTAFDSEEKKELFAMDVLDGEPDISVSRESYDSLKRMMRNDSSEIIPAGIPKLAGLVPERVRLNGPQFAQTFKEIARFPLYEFQPQMVLLQPYRLLIYYDKDIRDRYAILKRKLEESDDQGAAWSDDEQMQNENADVGAKSAREGETGTESGREAFAARLRARDATQQDLAKETRQQSEDKPTEKVEEARYPLADTKTALAYLECLINFMDTTVTIRRNFIQGTECRKVHFRDLWYLFSPGDEVVRRDEKQVYRVIEVVNPKHRGFFKNSFNFDDKDTSRYFQVSCVFVDFDGKKIGPVSTNFMIKAFAGEKSVDSLEVYPLRFHRYAATHERKGHSTSSGAQTLRQQLIKRGKRFFQAACMKLENTFYDGPTADGDEVESQVVVDFETALSSDNFDESRVPQIESVLDDADDASSTTTIPEPATVLCFSCCGGEYTLNDSFVEQNRKEEYIESLIPKDTYAKLPSVAIYPRYLDDSTGENALTDDEFLLMNYRVFAFVLRTRKWAELDLNFMEDATESDAQSHENEQVIQPVFEQLVLPEGHKNIVLSLISQHYRNRDSGRRSIDQSDIVRGKGKGLILLLHGAPGVGKTSTAEGIAEKFKKPLFTITCGDLGSTAKEVEQALDLNFNLANRWGCILLLDEADVFLASRTETDFERNGLVAVFLRVLEYYAGILFLTTNRVGVIDEAFRSRIHISLYYPPLGYNETRAVFNLNLKLIQDRFNNDNRNIKIERDEIIDYALDYFNSNDKARWNGRQIRNACQTALALAEFKAQGENHERWDPNADVRLAVENFKTVSTAYLEFTKYLKQLYGVYEDVRAKDLGLRARVPSRQSHAQSTQSPVSGGNIPQPYNSGTGNPMQTVHGQPYQSAPVVHMNPSFGVQQPSQQVAYYGNPAQVAPTSAFVTYGPSGQLLSGQTPQQSQEFMGMQFQPAQGNINQQAQPWFGQVSPPNSAVLPQQPSAQAQQQYQHQSQLGPGAKNFGSPTPVSQPSQAQQVMPAQQPTQQPQQQQAPQTWYPKMNVQNVQPGIGQNPRGPSSQEGRR